MPFKLDQPSVAAYLTDLKVITKLEPNNFLESGRLRRAFLAALNNSSATTKSIRALGEKIKQEKMPPHEILLQTVEQTARQKLSFQDGKKSIDGSLIAVLIPALLAAVLIGFSTPAGLHAFLHNRTNNVHT